MNCSEEVELALSARSVVYCALQRLLAMEPNREVLDVILGNETQNAFALFCDADDEAVSAESEGSFSEVGASSRGYAVALKRLTSCLADYAANKAEVLDCWCSEYTRLFLGPARLPAPPWESVYVGSEDILFQESTLRVRRAYLEQCYVSEGWPHVPDDHVATELDFMAKLARRSLDAQKRNDEIDFRSSLVAQSRFLDEHLLIWLPAFCARFSAAGETSGVFPAACDLAEAWCALDRALLRELLPEESC